MNNGKGIEKGICKMQTNDSHTSEVFQNLAESRL